MVSYQNTLLTRVVFIAVIILNMVRYKQVLVMVILILPLLLLADHISAKEKANPERKYKFRAILDIGVISPLDISELNGPNLQHKYSWMGGIGVGYVHKVYKGLSVAVSIGDNVYSYRYAADVMISAPQIPSQAFTIRQTEKFYCFYTAISLGQQFVLARKDFNIEGGVKLTRTPSLFLGHGQAIQDSIGITANIFNGEADFRNVILPIYFLRLGTPLFKKRTSLSVNIVYYYSPHKLGSGSFYFANTTNNSTGTFNIKASSMGIEFKFGF